MPLHYYDWSKVVAETTHVDTSESGKFHMFRMHIVSFVDMLGRSYEPDDLAEILAQTDWHTLIAAAKKDTDEVYKTVMAQKKALDYTAKHPGMPITYLLEMNSTSPDAVWRVFWGESAGTSEFSGVVDATTGQFVESLT